MTAIKLVGYALFIPGAIAAAAMLLLGPVALWRDQTMLGMRRFAVFFTGLAAVKASILFVRPELAASWSSVALFVMLAGFAYALSLNQRVAARGR